MSPKPPDDLPVIMYLSDGNNDPADDEDIEHYWADWPDGSSSLEKRKITMPSK